jgi:catechol 2,3-dioxygenase-like lactoylglutathione lyase family enzyme
MMLKITMVQINVSDMDQAIAWYRDVLGFEVAKEHDHYPVAVDLVHEGCRLLLHRAERAAQIDYPDVAQTLICLQTDDIAASMDSMRQRGAELLHDVPQPFPAGLFAAFRDPFGNVHELVELRS